MRLPNIVALEGIDASGKATQARMLADYFDSRIVPRAPVVAGQMITPAMGDRVAACLRRSFPAYQTDLGALIRDRLLGNWSTDWTPGYPTPPAMRMDANGLRAYVLQCLMTVNRHELADEIEYAVTVEGRSVVLDRYWASAVAYGVADGLDHRWLESVHTRLPKAHHVLIDIPVEESFRRRPVREDVYEADLSRLERARAAYHNLFWSKGVDTTMLSGNAPGHVSPSGWATVNGGGSPGSVHRAILAVLGLPGANT
jgi:dTMP kinase